MRARDNPFATVHLHRLSYRFQGVSWNELLDRLQRLDWRAAIVGPHGSGKTTLLEALAEELRQRGFETCLLRLSEDHPTFAPDVCDNVLSRIHAVERTTKYTKHTKTKAELRILADALGDRTESPLRRYGACGSLRCFFRVFRVFRGSTESLRLRDLHSGRIVLLDGAEQMGHWAWRRFERHTRGGGGLIITTHRHGRLPTLLTCETTPDLLGDVVQELLPNAPALSVATTRDLFFRHGGNLREALRELYDVYAQQPRFGDSVESESHARPHPDPLPQERGSAGNTLRTASCLTR
jgi:hypothetical protein